MHIVYKITNLINKKIYIGVHAVTDLEVDDGYMGSGKAIRLAIKKYGKENFKKEILVSFEDAEAAYLAESLVVDEEFIDRSDTYNMKCGGIGGTVGSGKKNPMFGKQHSMETKKKISDALCGENNPNYGKQRSAETKAKLSAANSGENNYNYGGHLSEEHKAKLSDAMMGRIFAEETKKKMSVAGMGENNSMFGKQHSNESKKKISGAIKEYWRLKKENNIPLTSTSR